MLTGKELEDLWFDDGFDGAITRIAQKYDLPPDELKQEVFLEITEYNSLSKTACRRAIWRAAQKLWRSKMQENQNISQDELGMFGYEPRDNSGDYATRIADKSRLSAQDQMVFDLVEIFQPTATRDVYRGKLVINGSPI